MNGQDAVSSSSSPASSFPLGAPPKHPEMPFNPFVNNSLPLSSPWEIIKSILMLPVFLVRVLILISCFILAVTWTNIALIGSGESITSRPFPKWRRNLLWPVQFLARVLLFSLGYHWIEVKGRPAPREEAPILICNHITFVDPIFVFLAHLPMIVTAKENLDLPFVGVIMRALQVVSVDRISPTSRKDAANEIKRKALCNEWPHVALFPEATTTNGRSLVSFKTGAFAPGLPVQPIVVKYPFTSLDPSWVAEGMPSHTLLFRVMSQLHNRMIVEYLDVVVPTENEKKDPRAFAERVRTKMAKALNIAVTEHSFGDVALALEALKMKMRTGIAVIEFGLMEKLFRLDVKEAKEFLRKFRTMDSTGSGQVSYEQFATFLNLPAESAAVRKTFDLFDKSRSGHINFREFVAGMAFISKHPQFRESIEAAFKRFDSDGDGELSLDDVVNGLRENFPTMTPQQIQSIAALLGLDKRASLSWLEFADFLQKHPEHLAIILSANPTLLLPPPS